MQRVLTSLRGRLDEREDDVRAYPLPTRLDYVHRGRALFPAGIDLRGMAIPEDLMQDAPVHAPSELSIFI